MARSQDTTSFPRPGTLFVRLINSKLAAQAVGEHIETVAKQLYPADEVLRGLIEKGVTNPANTTTAAWAKALVRSSIQDFLRSIAPVSAGAALLSRGTQLSFDGHGEIYVPAAIADATMASFAAEGAPLKATQANYTGPTLALHKLGAIVSFSRELIQSSNAEALTRTVLQEAVALAIDTLLLSDTAADVGTNAPAGLLADIVGLSPSVSTPASEALQEDVSALVAAVAPVAGNTRPVIVGSPKQAVRLMLAQDAFEVMQSNALADGTVICIATNVLISAVGQAVITASKDATIHTDSVPAQIGTQGAPNVAAATTLNLYQSDLIGLKIVADIDWGLRSASGVSFMESVSW
jgi:hypothetical protein